MHESKPDLIEKEVNWLSQSNVRLITPVKCKNGLGYELVHEKLIQAIYKLSPTFSPEIEQVNQLLRKRTNEWLGNDKQSYYLLRWKDLLKIHRKKEFIEWGELKKAKQEILGLSLKRLRKRILLTSISIVFLFIILSYQLLHTSIIEPIMINQRKQAFLNDLVFIQGGTFEMGSPETERGRENHETQHRVTLSSFFISSCEITNQQYCDFLNSVDTSESVRHVWINDSNPSCRIDENKGMFYITKGYKMNPVISVSWYGAKAFADWCNARLLTEAEWEYACRAGTKPENTTKDSVKYDEINSYQDGPRGEFQDKTIPVKSLPCNSFGLYGMRGNVWEWCNDWYDENYYKLCHEKGTVMNPTGPIKGVDRVLRGGSWGYLANNCRSADRNFYLPKVRRNFIGFRVARSHMENGQE